MFEEEEEENPCVRREKLDAAPILARLSSRTSLLEGGKTLCGGGCADAFFDRAIVGPVAKESLSETNLMTNSL